MIYCKAYLVEKLRAYPGWKGTAVEDLSADDICYLWEDFTLTRSCLDEERVPLLEVTDDWKKFCTTTLQFAVPEDIRKGGGANA